MIRQILGALSQNEKVRLVAKLKAARDLARGARVESHRLYKAKDECALYDELARLVAADPNASLASLGASLAAAGYVNGKGNVISNGQVARLKVNSSKPDIRRRFEPAHEDRIPRRSLLAPPRRGRCRRDRRPARHFPWTLPRCICHDRSSIGSD